VSEHSGRPLPPPPTSVSEQAQRFLSQRYLYDGPRPAPDDVDGWLQLIAGIDQGIAVRLGELQLPVATLEEEFGGVRTFVHRALDVPDVPEGPVYLNFHGGALIAGGGEACRMMTQAGALTPGMVTWAPDYRMPPLHPYPVPLDDCLAVYRALTKIRPPEDIFVGGASAGGNLAAALMVRAREEGLPMPAALVLITPELDLTESGDSFRTNLGIDNVAASLAAENQLYANGRDLADPLISPLFADVSGFPPTFLQCGTRDLFLSNTVRMHRRLREAGVYAELHVFEAMPHGGFGGAPEDTQVQREIRAFIDAHRLKLTDR
jgi:epsilon-lactone hydrolase